MALVILRDAAAFALAMKQRAILLYAVVGRLQLRSRAPRAQGSRRANGESAAGGAVEADIQLWRGESGDTVQARRCQWARRVAAGRRACATRGA